MVIHDITAVFRHLRKLLIGELMSAKRLEASRYLRTEEMASMLSRIATEKGGPSELNTHLSIMSTNIMSRMILRKRILGVEEQNHVSEMIQEFVDIVQEESLCFSAVHLGDFFKLPRWFDPQGLDKRFRNIRARMDRFYAKMVDQHVAVQKENFVSGRDKTLLGSSLRIPSSASLKNTSKASSG